MQHTKTPWRVGSPNRMGSVVADEPVPEIGGSEDVAYYGGHLIAESIAPRNAAFIVRACNSHEPLVAALKVADKFLSGFEGDELQDGIDSKITQIRRALAAAGVA